MQTQQTGWEEAGAVELADARDVAAGCELLHLGSHGTNHTQWRRIRNHF
jgi:hypothetical protein